MLQYFSLLYMQAMKLKFKSWNNQIRTVFGSDSQQEEPPARGVQGLFTATKRFWHVYKICQTNVETKKRSSRVQSLELSSYERVLVFLDSGE